MQKARMPLSTFILSSVLIVICFVSSIASANEVRRAAEPVAGRYIVALPASTMNVPLVASDLAKAYDGNVLAVWKHAVKGFWVEMSASNAEQLAKDKRVSTVEQDAVMHFSASGSQTTGPNAPPDFTGPITADPLWHLTRLSHRSATPPSDAAGLADYFTFRYANDGVAADGRRATVYLIDTGVRITHREFQNTRGGAERPPVEDGLNAASNPDVNVRVPAEYAPVDNSPSTQPCRDWLLGGSGRTLVDGDIVVHGTATASMVVGQYVGIAEGAVVISVNTLSCGAGPGEKAAVYTTAMLISAIDWVAVDALRPETRGLSVVSMSTFRAVETNGLLKCDASSVVNGTCVLQPDLSILELAMNELLNRGIPLFASANNQRRDACAGTPARLSRRGGLRDNQGRRTRIVTVGGTERNDDRWVNEGIQSTAVERGSNYGQCIDIWAPGHQLNVARIDGLYRTSGAENGTSYSAPLVAGIAARMLANEPTLFNPNAPGDTPDNVWKRLASNATQLDVSAHNLGPGSPGLLAYLGSVTFKTQPKSQIVAAGSVTLSVDVAETVPQTKFEWLRGVPGHRATSTLIGTGDATTIPPQEGGGTRSTISFTVCDGTATSPTCSQPLGLGNTFWVRVTHPTLSTHYADSNSAKIEIGNCALPEITQQPESVWIPEQGSSATLNATVASSVAYCYQWQHVVPQWDAEVDTAVFANVTNGSGSGNATPGTTIQLNPAQTGPVGYYRLIVWPSTSCSTGSTGTCRAISETAQVRVCTPPTVAPFGVTERDYDIAGTPAQREPLTTAVTNASSQTWLFSATPGGPFTPLRVDYPDGWELFHGNNLVPPKAGYYKLRAENSCGFAISSNSVHITSSKDFDLLASINDVQPPLGGGLFANRRLLNCGTRVKLQIYPRTGGQNLQVPFRRPLVITWTKGETPSTTVVPNDTLLTTPIGRGLARGRRR